MLSWSMRIQVFGVGQKGQTDARHHRKKKIAVVCLTIEEDLRGSNDRSHDPESSCTCTIAHIPNPV